MPLEHDVHCCFTFVPWCRYLSAQEGVEHQLYADNLKCVSRDPALLLRAAGFTTGDFRLVGQELAPCKCLFFSTSKAVRKVVKDWVLSQEGDKWSVKFDVRDLGGHLDTTSRGWSATLASRVRLVIARLVVIFALRWIFMVGFGMSGLCVYRLLCTVLKHLCSPLIVCASFARLFTGWSGVVVSPWLVLVTYSALWVYLQGVTLLFVWSGLVFACCVGIWLCGLLRLVVLIVFMRWLVREALVFLSASAAEIGFRWDPLALGWSRLGLTLLCNLAGPVQHFKAAILDAWRNWVSADLCDREGLRCGPLLDVHGSSQLLNSSHVSETDQALLRSVMVCGVGNGFLLSRVRGQLVPCRFCGAPDNDGHLFGIVPFLLLLRFVKILNFVVSFEWTRFIGPLAWLAPSSFCTSERADHLV